ncbi:MAG TPA: ABC transporter permease [Bryobacteraceae bacterium]|nr:ABC transporter permease [Bryobacteraceae bacterium]
MVWTSKAKQFWRFTARRRQMESELDEELRACAALLEDEGMEQVKESVRDQYAGIRLNSLGHDFRYAWRTLWKSRSFTAVALLTLVLGIGANTAIFSVVYAVLLRPLPYDRPEQLALIWSSFQKTGAPHAPTSTIAYREIRQRSRTLQDVGAIWVGSGTFIGGEEPEQVKVAQVTPNFLSLLGVTPALGRVFAPDSAFGEHTIVLSYGLWQRRFGGDPQIVGKTVPMQGGNPTVVGVMPAGFQLYFSSESNVAMDVQAFVPFDRFFYKQPVTLYYLRVVARLKPGIGRAQAQDDLDSVASQIRSAYTALGEENMTLTLAPMQEDAVREIRPALLALFAGAGLVLLIACVNVANLLLERASARRREMALRTALGAGRGRILRQLFLEGLTLCGVGAILGVALGWAGVRALLSLRTDYLVQIRNVGLNWPVLIFVAAVTLGSAMVFGLAPAWESTRLELMENLREGSWSAAPARRRLSAALIVGEVMLGFVLVIGAGLMIRTLANLRAVRPGFDAQQVLTFQLRLPPVSSEDALFNWVKDWEASLAALPGVEAVGATSHIPLGGFANWYSAYRPEGLSETQAAGMIADYRCVTPGYFRAMSTRLVEGRFFNSEDRSGGRRVVIVDDLLARKTWPGESALGKRIFAEHTVPNGFQPDWAEVVGVVEHVRNHSLSEQVRPEVYFAFAQSPRSPLNFAVRLPGDPLALVPAIRKELARRNPNMAISNVRGMEAYVESARGPASFTAVLAAIFAALALLLAAVGIYGVISYSVSRRSRELGVRMALGASSGEVMRMVQREGLTLMGVGLLLGFAAALAVSRWLRGLIYGVSPIDPLTYALAFAAIVAATLLGCWRPAAKAARANPMDAIRAE